MLLAILGSLLLAGPALTVEAAPEAEKAPPKAQTVCPVMGGEINKDIFADHEGKRVYFCCKACVETFKKDAAKYTEKLEKDGVTLDRVCACGHVKGSADCRKACQAGKCQEAGCKADSGCASGAGCPAGAKKEESKTPPAGSGCCPH
jgi:YHS domain-containing protein